MKRLVAVVRIPACERDYTTTKGAIIEWDENSKKLFIDGKEKEWKGPNYPNIGDRIYCGECFSSSDTCAHCHQRELYGEIEEFQGHLTAHFCRV